MDYLPRKYRNSFSYWRVALSQENCTLLSPIKKAKGKKGSLVAIVAGTKTEQVIEHVSDSKKDKPL
jgi:hypothetical protein